MTAGLLSRRRRKESLNRVLFQRKFETPHVVSYGNELFLTDLRRPLHCRAFSLIEVIGVLAVLAIVAVLLAPSVIREMDQATLTQEIANLNAFSNALVLNILQTKTIPDNTTLASAIASNLFLPSIQISNNSRNFTRLFLVDPLSSFGSDTPPYSQPSPLYIQTSIGLTNNAPMNQPTNVRVLIVSTLATGNPPVLPSSLLAEFDDIWNTPVNQIPSYWAYGLNPWKGDPAT